MKENFDKIWTDLPPEDSPCATPDHPSVLNAFKDFSYYGRSQMMSPPNNYDRGHANVVIEGILHAMCMSMNV